MGLDEEEEVLVQSLNTEAKASIQKITSIVDAITDKPNSVDPKELEKYSSYLCSLYKNYKVHIELTIESTKICRRMCSIRSSRETLRSSSCRDYKKHSTIRYGSLFICLYIQSSWS